ncbi:hypothetical protein [Paenibacillus sp. FSL H8-0537]|uniref:hypothetical protein n=1 Tax=Paenibacillus sp. FSL H8-0537 TaxID=2921399 RepID=UPI003100D34F
MNTTRQFLFTLFAWILFMIGGFIFLKNESSQLEQLPILDSTTPYVSSALYKGTGNLNQISGDQVIGMVPFALNGEYTLSIDGIRVDADTDIEEIDLRGVSGLSYTLSVTRTNGKITAVRASH